MKLTRRWKRILIAALVVSLLIPAYAWLAYIDYKFRNTYGAVPSFGWVRDPVDAQGTEYCIRITDVTPDAHYNIFGRMWQDPHILWEDVEVIVKGEERPHGMKGPARPGDRLCDFPESGFTFTHLPTGKLLVVSR